MKSRQNISAPLQKQGGVALLEVLISVVMLAMGVLALIGLQASMNTNLTEAKYRAEASYLANQLVGQMWVDQANLSGYAIASGACTNANAGCTAWLATVANRLPGGSATVTIAASVVTVTVTWQAPGSGIPHNYLLNANVMS